MIPTILVADVLLIHCSELIQNLPKKYVVDSQRLVRLYPFAKQRTRGNAAVAIRIEGDDYTDLLLHLDYWWNEK